VLYKPVLLISIDESVKNTVYK